MTFIDKCDNYKKFQGEFNTVVLETIQNTGDELVTTVTEQMYSGLDGNENNLLPTYTADPFFDTPGAGRWRFKAEQYRKWKEEITPPSSSFVGFSARGSNTPNLTITYRFHDSITYARTNTGITVYSPIDLGRDIETKYGSQIFKISGTGKKWWYKKFFKPILDTLVNKYKK